MILTLDVSTSITGITVMGDEVLLSTSVDTRNKKKYPHVNDVANAIEAALMDIAKEYKITYILIEESLTTFRSGFSSANTLSKLSKINGLATYLCEKIFAIRPEKIMATSARKKAGIIIKKADPRKAKEVAFEFVTKNVPQFTFELTRSGNPKPESYDRSDSIVIALAARKMLDECP